MKSAEYIKRLIENAKIKTNPDVKKSALEQLINELEKTKRNPAKIRPDTGRIIMNRTIFKLAAAAIIVIAIIIGYNQFGGSAAFGDVLGYIQKHSYTFDLEGLTMKPIHVMVYELGRMRVDFPILLDVGNMSSITDFNTGQTLLLFHEDKTAVMKKEPALNKSTGTDETIFLCTRPIAELWNVLDGAEEYLGEKEIEGKRVSGFRITKEDQNYKYDITLWADYKKGFPYMVETTAKSLGQSSFTITTTMKNFNIDAVLDEKLFSLKLPQGYTIAYQENLDDIKVDTKLTPEGEKIVQVVNLASGGSENEAVETLMTIDWSKPVEFGKEPYIFSISEKQYNALKADDQKRVDEQNSTNMTTIRKLSQEVLDKGKAAVSAKQYGDAEKSFNASLQLGILLEQNQNSMLIVQLVGISIEKKALNEMIPFYTSINDNEKLQRARKQLSAVEAVAENIKKQASEMSK
jgi:outer membrane lipoprotein-sorting protein